MAKMILDISHHDPVTNWAKLKDEVSFLIFKGTEGTSFVDPTANKNIEMCEKLNIPYWIYTFLKKGGETDQAKFLVKTFEKKVGENFIGYALDAERGNSPSGLKRAHDYLRTVSNKVLVYTAHHYYYLYKDFVKTFDEHTKWWEPRYSSEGPHAGVDLWQFSESIRCSYISGKVDANLLMGKTDLKWFTTKEVNTEMKKTAAKLIEQAKSWYGRREGNGSHKKIIDVYNSHKPRARDYKVQYTDAWCATFVSACAIATGMTDIIPTECSCNEMIKLCKKKGIWVENENRTPRVGDIIFYDWQDSGKGDNKGSADHVGIVLSVRDGKIGVIEGNYHDAVGIRYISVNGKNIRGFACPKYDSGKPDVPKKETKKTPSNKFKKYTGLSGSLVDALKVVGAPDTSYQYRKKIAAANGIPGYSGEAAENLKLLRLLKEGRLTKPN